MVVRGPDVPHLNTDRIDTDGGWRRAPERAGSLTEAAGLGRDTFLLVWWDR